MSHRPSRAAWGVVLPAILMAAGCTPTVRVEAPKEPIVINLNVKIEQEVRVKVDREVEDLLETEPGLF